GTGEGRRGDGEEGPGCRAGGSGRSCAPASCGPRRARTGKTTGFVAGLRVDGRARGSLRLEPERYELCPRRDAHLREHVAQVEVDSARAEEQLGPNLTV